MTVKISKFIQDYYSSINEVVLNKALMFVMSREGMTRKEVNVSLAERKFLISYKNKLWNTKDSSQSPFVYQS